jgi:hypothetical protein
VEDAVHAPECPREAELLAELVAAGPDGWPDHLRAHVEACSGCRALAEVVLPLQAERHALIQRASVPSSAVMWWRLETRSRREAARQAMRPIAVVQAITLACALGLLAAVAEFLAPDLTSVTGWLGALGSGAAAAGTASLSTAGVRWLTPVGISAALAGALLLVVTPLAIFFASNDE